MCFLSGTALPIPTVITVALLIQLFAIIETDAAPSRISGKSVAVAWTENRVVTPEGQTNPIYMIASEELRIYVSDTGHIFSKPSSTYEVGGRGYHRAQSVESLQGPSDSAASRGRTRALRFEANVLIVDTKWESGARRVSIHFDGSYASCNAAIIQGKEGGARAMTLKSNISEQMMKIQSIQTSAASCTIRDGNIFVE